MRRDQQHRSQPTLFDSPVVYQPVARNTDPQTSHIAAEAVAINMPRSLWIFMEVMKSAVGPLTANEVGEAAAKAFAECRAETIRKRSRELEVAGKIKVAGERKCSVTGYMALTYIVSK